VPELPEVETIVRGLARVVVGRSLRYARLDRPDVLRGITPGRFLRHVRNARVEALDRRAKHIVFTLEGARRLVIQLRMTGNLLIVDRRLRAVERRYAVFRASLGDGLTLLYRDVRRLGTISLLNETGWRSYTDSLGPEPLDPAFDAEAVARALSRSRQAVKKLLMDQRRLAGVGNIYANEALFVAGIDPSRPGCRLTREESLTLLDAVRRILTEAVTAGGTTFRDYRNAAGEPGTFQAALRVYGRAGRPCVRCGTRLAGTHAIDQRATVFCYRCQT